MRALRFDRATSKGRGFGRISCLSALLGLLCVCVWYVCTLCPSSSPRLLLRQAATMHRRMRVCGC